MVLVLYDVPFIRILVAATVSMAAPHPAANLSTMHNAKKSPLFEIKFKDLQNIYTPLAWQIIFNKYSIQMGMPSNKSLWFVDIADLYVLCIDNMPLGRVVNKW